MNPARRARAPFVRALVVAVVLAPACGPAQPSVPPGDRATTPPAAMPVLARSAVPGVPSTTRDVTAADLGKDAPIANLVSRLAAWGFLGGRERTFQGESTHLTYVQSRSLAFADVGGASGFVAFVRDNAARYFGIGTRARPLATGGRRGWVFVAPACACHLANPVDYAVLLNGSLVVWLEINGPDATPALLRRLLAPSNFETASP